MFGVIVKEYGVPTYRSVELYSFTEFYDYVKANKDVWRVVVPHTGYGYGTGLIESANLEWLEANFKRAIQLVEYNATFSRSKFLRDEYVRELIQGLAEDYPLLSDDIHSRLQSEAQEEAWDSWAASEVDSDMSPSELLDVLEYSGNGLWNVLQFDTDGSTVYFPKQEIEWLRAYIAELSANQ
jgi:hypothetical protein